MAFIQDGLPCDSCGSSDAVAEYSDGFHCFACGKNSSNNNDNKRKKEKGSMSNSKPKSFIEGEVKPLTKRGISAVTCDKWGYKVGKAIHPETKQLTSCQIANFYDKNTLVGQKIRFPDKKFITIGDTKSLYGKHLWNSGRKIVITEGELDALSVSQVQSNKYPVVSLPNGSSSARKTLEKELSWLQDNFEEIILMFDMDEPGQHAVSQVAPLFTPGKLKVANLSLKDANEMLLANRAGDLVSSVFNAKPYRPDGIITAGEVIDGKDFLIEMGDTFPFPSMTSWSKGMRPHEMYAYGAGTGVSKTDTTKDIVAHLIKEHDRKIGVIYLEEPDLNLTVNSIAGKMVDINYLYVEDSDEENRRKIKEAKELLREKLVMYRTCGDNSIEHILDIIRNMVVALGCNHIVLDHITLLVDGMADAYVYMQKLMRALNSINKELPFTLHYISHLRKSGDSKKTHEEGARVTLDDFVGGKANVQYAHCVYGLERDQQSEDEQDRFVTRVRLLKCRMFGANTGKTCLLKYDLKKGKKEEIETINQDSMGFTNESEGVDNDY